MAWVRQVWLLLIRDLRRLDWPAALVTLLLTVAILADLYDPWSFEAREAPVDDAFDDGAAGFVFEYVLRLVAV